MDEVLTDLIAALTQRVLALESRQLKFCGPSHEGEQHDAGEPVTHAGSLWHCNCTTRARPGMDHSFTLAVKRGRAGVP
jgi:hypothetical protein